MTEGMHWETLKNGDRIAKGEEGDFLIWKTGPLWSARYRSKSGKTFMMPRCRYIADLKALCESNFYWE